MSTLWKFGALTGALALATTVAMAPRPTQACGGTFCDAGPQSMPVDQSGENILFVVDGNEIEAHIQIQYEGDPENFAWVIPLMAVPDFSIGSEALFQNLLAGTVPAYGFSSTQEQCPTPQPQTVPDRGDGGDNAASGGGLGGMEEGDGPTVVHREQVGAYQIAVLQGGEADEVIEWLDQNGYQQDPEAEPIIREYLAEGQLFGAIKLTAGADVDQIHPIVLRYRSDEPCIPLRLTRIAAVEDMEVRTFFLGDERMVPTNYRHVLVNPLKIDWLQLGSNYKEVISGAVDAEHANGRAFVTEYAGPSQVVGNFNLSNPAWSSSPFRSAQPSELPRLLEDQGLWACGFEDCQFGHPLVGGILSEFLTLPEDVSADEYIGCPECYPEVTQWDGEGFADAFDERIAGPGEHAQELLSQWSYVTRMYTTISPHEMTEDPIFHARGDLDDVVNNRLGNSLLRCSGDTLFTLPDGREVFIPAGSGWPEFPNEMPWEEEVAEMATSGAPMVLSNRTAEIDELLAAYNVAAGYGQDGCGSCQIEATESSRGRWAMGLAFVALGAGAAVRRRRRR
ncbi:MAG: DUF2330 domain-containing protein [Deltaproteobacteria bacterium]|nr:DUF2330 domain-containing protein [Deltaproteobacteria bacterium]